jgi:hypothetical protein
MTDTDTEASGRKVAMTPMSAAMPITRPPTPGYAIKGFVGGPGGRTGGSLAMSETL